MRGDSIAVRRGPLGSLMAALEPAVSNGEKKIDVIAWILIAEAGAGKVGDRTFKEKCLMALHEDVAAEGDAWSEVHLRSIPRRNILSRKNNAADGGYVRSDGAAASEIPLPNYRANAAAPYCTLRRKNDVHGQDICSPFEIPA